MEENSAEEAVKTMEHWIEYEKNNKDKINKADELINIQETILSDHKRVLKENKDLKENCKKCIIRDELDEYVNNSIPVQKIKDKVEELYKEDRELTEELEKPDSNFKNIDRNLKRIKNKIDVLQELLEK